MQTATLEPQKATLTARDTTSHRIAHLSHDNGQTSLCGARLNGRPVSSGSGRCMVCLAMATADRFSTR